MSERTAAQPELDTVVHLTGTELFFCLNWDDNWILNPGILAFTHIVLRLYEASASTFRTCL